LSEIPGKDDCSGEKGRKWKEVAGCLGRIRSRERFIKIPVEYRPALLGG
jgi:hypothetical protein